jgi:hypothetical protein
MKRFSISILFSLLFFTTVILNGQTILTSLEEIAAFGAENNLDYKSSQIDLLQAEEDRVGIFKLEESSITAEGIIPGDISNSVTAWGFSSTLSVPIIDQLEITGTINADLSGQVGVTLRPLVHSDLVKQSEIDINSALISAESSRIISENDAVGAALNWMSAQRDFEAQQKSAELAEISYLDDKVRYDLGEVTLDDLHDSLIDWSEARKLLSEKLQDFRKAESDLYKELGSGSNEVTLDKLDVISITDSLELLKKSININFGDPMKNDQYRLSLLGVQGAESSLKNKWTFEPDLKAGVNLIFNQDGSLNANASISITLSFDDFQKKQRDIAKEELQLSISEAEQSRNEAELDFEQILEALISSEINSEISQLEYEQAEIMISEAVLLQELGDYSEIELQETQLTLSQAKNTLFKALSDEYIAWLELKKYM